MGNVTVTPRNVTNSTNNSFALIKKNPKVEFIPPFRGPQTLQAIEGQIVFLIFLVVAALAINIIMTILLQKKFKSLPYIMLQNIVVVDMLTALMNGPLFLIGVILDQYGIIFQNICNVQGFFHSSLCAVFLNTVSMVAISRCLAILKPSLYHKIFVNKIVLRLLLLAIWASSALISTPPMNDKEGWGAYRKLETTCWLAWLPDQKGAMAYNVIVTIVTLGGALASSVLAAKVVFSSSGKVMASEPGLPPPYPGTGQQNTTGHLPEKQPTTTALLNTEVFFLCAAMFLLYIILWVPLTVMDWQFLKDWRDLDHRVTIAFIFLFIGRSLFNPILCFIISASIRKEFVNLFVRCKCIDQHSDQQHVEF